jgi:hypothetical protein
MTYSRIFHTLYNHTRPSIYITCSYKYHTNIWHTHAYRIHYLLTHYVRPIVIHPLALEQHIWSWIWYALIYYIPTHISHHIWYFHKRENDAFGVCTFIGVYTFIHDFLGRSSHVYAYILTHRTHHDIQRRTNNKFVVITWIWGCSIL